MDMMVTDSPSIPPAHFRVHTLSIPVMDETPEADDDEAPETLPTETPPIPIQDPPPERVQPPQTVRASSCARKVSPACIRLCRRMRREVA
jgi:hypothetical protein